MAPLAARFSAAIVSSSSTTAFAGLQTADEFRASRAESDRAAEAARLAASAAGAAKATATAGAASSRAGVKRKAALLSFDQDDGVEEKGAADVGADTGESKLRTGKDPTVATDFLPDAPREAREAALRAELAAEWTAQQERAKAEALTITYSYWDGSGHRREAIVPKGTSIGKFLEKVHRTLAPEFPELKTADSLLYVKEDLIIPHNFTFYELIETQARGKTGPLFSFGVHDDVRLTDDARVERTDSHPGKVMDRRWYEKHKHIFPMSRYEVYDPAVSRDGQKFTLKSGGGMAMDGAPSKHK